MTSPGKSLLTLLAALAFANAALASDAADDGIRAVALGEGNRLLRFDVARPGETEEVALSGVGGTLLGIDRRPADGRLYAVSDANDLYVVDPDSGEARRVSSLTLGFEGTPHSGFDFNPQADRLRLVAGSGQNLRVHVTLGAVATDGPLAYAAGDVNAGAQPRISAVAYTDNVADAPVTRLFDIDWERDVLLLQEPPNDGALQTVGPLGVDFAALAAFDIFTRPDGTELALGVTGNRLYAIDLESGAARELGAIGADVPILGLALVPAEMRPPPREIPHPAGRSGA